LISYLGGQAILSAVNVRAPLPATPISIDFYSLWRRWGPPPPEQMRAAYMVLRAMEMEKRVPVIGSRADCLDQGLRTDEALVCRNVDACDSRVCRMRN